MLEKLLNVSEPGNMAAALIVTDIVRTFSSDFDIVSSDGRGTHASIPSRRKTGALLREHMFEHRLDSD